MFLVLPGAEIAALGLETARMLRFLALQGGKSGVHST